MSQPELVAIVALTENRVIGRAGGMPWHLPADVAHFKRLSVGRPNIMGRRVFDSLGNKPLPGRQNIILTRNPDLMAEGAVVVHTPEAALQAAGNVPEIAIIGGEEIYRLYWDRLTRLELTLIHAELGGDTFFPEIGPEWELITEQFRPANLVVGEGGPVTFSKSGTTIETGGARPLLEEAEDAGLLMPSGCRMGICYGCVLPLRSGTVRDLRSGDLTTASPGETDRGGVPIQTCINAAAGSCEIDH